MSGGFWLELRTAPKISRNKKYFSHLKKIYTDKINLYYLLYIYIYRTGSKWFRTIVFLNETISILISTYS